MQIRAVSASFCFFVLIALPTIAWGNQDCVGQAMRAYKQGGARAALPHFEKMLKDPVCRNDPKLNFNYARSLSELVKQDGNDIRSCVAGEIFQTLQTEPRLPEFMRTLAAQDVPKLLKQCHALSVTLEEAAYQSYVKRARGLTQEGHIWRAVLEWRALLRLNDRRVEPQRALCKLLPSLGRHDEAAARCASWRSQVMETTRPDTDNSRTTAWVFTGLGGASLLGAIVVYGMASSTHNDLLDAREEAQNAANEFRRNEYDVAAAEYNSLQTKMQTLQYTSWGLLGGGILFGGIATYLWLDPGKQSVAVTPDGILFTAEW